MRLLAEPKTLVMQRFLSYFAVLVVAFSATAATASAQFASKRHLVYTFNVGIVNDSHDTNSAARSTGAGQNGGTVTGTGDTQYTGTASDKGEIAVDIAGVEADGGLVVNVSESAHTYRTASAVTCVVYASTNVVCGTGVVNPEEISVLRTLSPKFFDASNLDAKHHWHVGDDAAGVAIDFTALPQPSGALDIDAQRSEKMSGSARGSIQSNAKYVYDMAKLMPTTISEYTTVRQETGPGQYANITVDFKASLSSDSSKG